MELLTNIYRAIGEGEDDTLANFLKKQPFLNFLMILLGSNEHHMNKVDYLVLGQHFISLNSIFHLFPEHYHCH